MQTNRDEYQYQAEIGRMADEAIEAGAIEFLRIENRYVGAERFAQGEDRRPADGERNDQNNHTEEFQGAGSAEHVGRRGFADPNGSSHGTENDDPKEEKGSAVVDFARALLGARADSDDYF